MTILLTGAAGFIGSHLAEQLLASGSVVVGLDNFDDQYDPARKYANLRLFSDHPGFRFVPGDIRDRALVTDTLGRFACDTVVHLAARTGVRSSVLEPARCLDVNVTGTLSVLEAMRMANVRRLVMASSSSVYGNSARIPFAEDDPASQPLSPYALSKRSAELLAHTYHHLHQFDVSCLRFFTVYGPRQRPDMAISQFTQKLYAGQPITLFGDGSTARNYTYVSDAVDGIIRALHRLGGFDVLNIAGMRSVGLPELVRLIGQTVERSAVIDWQPVQPGDVTSTEADLRRAHSRLGYAPSVDLNQGLSHFNSWYRQAILNERVNA